MKDLQIGSYLLMMCTIKASVHKLAPVQEKVISLKVESYSLTAVVWNLVLFRYPIY